MGAASGRGGAGSQRELPAAPAGSAGTATAHLQPSDFVVAVPTHEHREGLLACSRAMRLVRQCPQYPGSAMSDVGAAGVIRASGGHSAGVCPGVCQQQQVRAGSVIGRAGRTGVLRDQQLHDGHAGLRRAQRVVGVLPRTPTPCARSTRATHAPPSCLIWPTSKLRLPWPWRP